MRHFIKTIFFLLVPVFVTAQQDPFVEMWSDKQIDSLREVWKHTAGNDTMQMRIARSLGWFYQENNRDSSLYFQSIQLKLARKLKLKLWEADALDQGGWILAQIKNYPLSLQYFIGACDILENRDCEKNIWFISLFSKDKDPVKARLTCLSSTYNDMSQLYKSTGNNDKELFYLSQGLKTAQSINNSTMIALITLNKAGADLRNGQADSALNHIRISLDHMKKSGYITYEGEALKTLGDIFMNKNDLNLAKQYYDESFTTNMVHRNKTGISNSLISLASYYSTTGTDDSAFYYIREAIEKIKDLNNDIELKHAYFFLHGLYKKNGNQDSAYYYLQRYSNLNDSLNKAEKEKIDSYQNVGFNQQLEKQQQEKKRLQKENKIRTYTLLTSIGVFTLIAFLMYRNNRIRKKAHQLLQVQNEEIETQKTNLELTLIDLKTTQAQLIQSEKMASLGELTAGIAHEIQNPLNFVNNFSELNNELIKELEEETKKELRDSSNETDIITTLKENSEKINHHGKRAESIVKGMLEHSRKSTGVKEPTDINKLCDEFVRLSYHGLRAKDSKFNCDYTLDPDPDLPLVNVVSQDIGRVILNIVNNAFQACIEKSQYLNKKSDNINNQMKNDQAPDSPSGGGGKELVNKEISFSPTVSKEANDAVYHPLVTILTKSMNDKIEFRISDNGLGISDNIKDKIFQPFFTTKPTGQGTGLGLSLAYDIVKAHGGEISVKSEVGLGTEFIIQLPIL